MKTNMTIGKESSVKAWSRRVLMALAVGGAMLSGCTEEENKLNNDKEKGETFTFTAVAPTGSMTKAVWDAEPNATTGKLGFNWKDTDTQIALWQSGDTEIKTATMTVNADQTVTITADGIDSEKSLSIRFPADKATVNNGSMTFETLPAELTQKGATTDHLQSYMYLTGILTTEQLVAQQPVVQLSHSCAVLRFKVKNGTSNAVRVTKVEMLATEGNNGVSIGNSNNSDITVNVQDATNETKGHELAAGEALSVYAHCMTTTNLKAGQFQFRVTVTDADGNNPKVFLTKEEFSVENIKTVGNQYLQDKNFQSGYYYTFHLDISRTGDGERFEEIPVWTSSTVASTPEGEGTSDSPYLIASAENLAWLLSKTNASSPSNFNGKYFKLTTDIFIESDGDNPWVPIAKSNAFKGTFDGDGHTISGTMVADNTSSQYDVNFGFFGHIGTDATIKNLNIYADVTGKECYNPYSSSTIYRTYTGSVVGQNNSGTITNCTASGTVTGGKGDNYSESCTGGIAGYSEGIITNCTNNGAVNGANGKISYAGGIVGYSYSSSFTNCTNNGTITGAEMSGDRSSYTGGIVGKEMYNGSYTNCSNTGDVTGAKPGGISYAGGIIGEIRSGTISGCSNNGAVFHESCSSQELICSGGLAGSNFATITCSTNKGTVTTNNPTSDTGGLVGYNTGTVCTCCRDESGYKNYLEKLTPICAGTTTQTQVNDCTGTHE